MANPESGGNGIIPEGTWIGNPLQIVTTDDAKIPDEHIEKVIEILESTVILEMR